MADAKAIRQNAKQELGKWFAKSIKETIVDAYKIYRGVGLRAVDALELARWTVQYLVNEDIKKNFYGRSPF